MSSDLNFMDRIEGQRSAVDQVANRIRDAILSGRLAPGVHLKEKQLAEQLGVSRIPIREALSRLEAEGFVARAPYRGTMVAKLTTEQVTESFMLRALTEGFASELATPRLSQGDLANLRRIVAQLNECIKAARHDELPILRREFHSAIYNRCGSAKLISWIDGLYYQFPRNLRRSFRFAETVGECSRIIDAFEARDSKLAGELMSEHILKGSQVTAEFYANIIPEADGSQTKL